MQKIAVIIPAYNEELNIERTLQDIDSIREKLPFEIFTIVVNDCSTDNTSEKAKTLANLVLSLTVNLGIGGAVQTGILYAHQNKFDYALQFDGDGQHRADQIEKLIRKMNNTNADLVIGSRFLENKGYSSTPLRRFGIKIFQKLLQLYTGLHISDATSGFRLMNKRAIEAASKIYPDEYPEPEIIVIFKKLGLTVTETPVQMNPRLFGSSSIDSLHSIYYMVKVCLALTFSALKNK